DGAAVGALVLPTAVGQPLGWAVGVGVNRRAHQESSSRRAVVASTNVARGVGSLPWSSTILRNRPPRPAAVCRHVVATMVTYSLTLTVGSFTRRWKCSMALLFTSS